MSTTIEAKTNKIVLDAYIPGQAEKALRSLSLGQLLKDLSAPTEEAFDVDASLQCTLSKVPIGAVVCMFTEGAANVPLTQIPLGETPGATEFTLDYSTRQVTAGGTVANGEELSFVYTGLTAASDATGSALADALAASHEAS